MKFYDIVQGTPEWFQARLGIATASNFSNIITPKQKKFSASADEYADKLISELITGDSVEKFAPTYWMERGAEMEADACKLYEFETGYTVLNGGFMTDDDHYAGCSPDVRVFDNSGKLIGTAEIKCPAPWTHVGNMQRTAVDPDNLCQVQGQIYVSKLEFVDWFSYHPDMPPAKIRAERDNEFQEALRDCMYKFERILLDKIAILKDKGVEIPERTAYLPKPKKEKESGETFFAAG